ncbi:MAG TPA: hypothetical protein VGO47_13570, partial [Chlamydiales bacterium]|nr:hypothetical protein [Chlamydiales bacterium]
MRMHDGTKSLGAGRPHPDVIASFPPVPETPRFRVRVAPNIMMNAEASKSNARHIINDVKPHSTRPEEQVGSQQRYHSTCAPYISRSGSLLSPPLSELVQAISTDI